MHKALLATVGAIAVGALLLGMPATAIAAEPPADPASAGTTVADRLVEAADAGRSSPEELADAAGLPVGGPASLSVDAGGRVAATVVFAAAPSEAQLARVRELAEVTRVYDVAPAVAVRVAPSGLDDLAAIPGVVSADPDLAPATASVSAAGVATALRAAPAAPSCRAFPADADAPERADAARAEFGVDGTGVTVGILSDSYANRATQAEIDATEVSTGLLPGPGNPCGYETPVEVLADYEPGSAQPGGDEGRAMAELVHGIAPGARLMFHTAQGAGPVGFAQGIVDLAAHGARVIVDDIGYSTETYYQQSIVSAAIEQVRAQGVAYYTSAGNQNTVGAGGTPSAGKPIASWRTPQYRAMDCPDWVEAPEEFEQYDCLDFDPSSGEDATDLLDLEFDPTTGPPAPTLFLSWGEPIGGVTASLDLQLYRDDATPVFVASGSQVAQQIPNVVVGMPADATSGEYDLVLVRDLTAGAAPAPALWIGTFGSSDAIYSREHDTSRGGDVVGPTSFGHPADGSGVGVAAAYWATPQTPEGFSSLGPGTVLFEPYDPPSSTPAAPLPAPLTIPAPRIAGVDGVRTSFFSQQVDGVWRFFGTSAAAPNVAAVHALALSYAPGASADTILGKLLDTAAPMDNPYADVDDSAVFGAGMVDAAALLRALPAPAPASATATALSATELGAQWTAVPGAAGYEVEVRQDDAVVAARQAAADATSATFAGLLPDAGYRVRVTTLNAAGERGGSTDSAPVRTPIPPHPAVVPSAPAESSLVADAGGGVTVDPGTAAAGAEVRVTGLPPRTWAYGWLYSTPTALGWAWVDASGTAVFAIPDGVPAGAHRIVATDASGAILGWTALSIAPPALAATGLGVDLTQLTVAALLALLAGIAAMAVTVRRPLRRSR